MTIAEMINALDLEVGTKPQNLDITITGGCASDLLSYVMGRAKAGNIWITIQVHPNIVGVCELLELAAIIVADGQQPEPATLEKARQQGVAILTSRETAFTLAGKLFALGVK